MANKINQKRPLKGLPAKPPTITERRAGASMPGKPPTIAEQRLIRRYGDLPTARRAQETESKRIAQVKAQEKAQKEFKIFKSKEQEQKIIFQTKIENLNKQNAESWKIHEQNKWDKSERRKQQIIRQGIKGELEVYEQALKGLEGGGYYKDLGVISSQATKYGNRLKGMQQEVFSARTIRDQEKDKLAQQAGFSSYKQLLDKTKHTVTTAEGTQFVLKDQAMQPIGAAPTTTTTTTAPEQMDLSGFQVKIDPTKDIKISDSSKVNVTDVPTGIYLGVGSSKPPKRNFFSRVFGSSQDFSIGESSAKETFDPRTGLVSGASEPSGQATVFSRPETPSETETRDIIPSKVGQKIFGEKKSENIFTVNLQDLERTSKDYKVALNKYEQNREDVNKIADQLTKLEKGNVDILGESWTGSQKDFDKYQETYKSYQTKVSDFDNQKNKLVSMGATETDGKLRPPTIKSGAFGLTRDIPITEFDQRGRPTAFGSKVIASTAGSITGKGTERTLDFFGYKGRTIPEKKVTITEPQFGSLGYGDTGFVEKEVTVPGKERTSMSIGTGVSKGTEVGVQLGKYFVPYAGVGIFAGEVTETGIGIGQTIQSGEKLSKEERLELLTLGGALITIGALKYGGILLRVSSKASRAERASYKQALKDYNTLRDSSASVRVVETAPSGGMSVELSNVQVNNLVSSGALNSINIAKNTAKNVRSIKVSQTSQKLLQKYPDMKKVKQPGTENFVYYVDSSERTLYRNIITYEVKLANGQVQTISVVSFTNKPLTQFRSLDSALKYGRGKRLFTGVTEEGSKITKIEEIKKSGKPGDKFLARVDQGKVETRKVGALEKYEQNVDSLFKYSEPVGRSKALRTLKDEPTRLITPLFEADTKVSKTISATKTQQPITDLSIAKRFADIKPGKSQPKLPPERRTPLSRTFAEDIEKARQLREVKPNTLDPIKLEAKIEAPTRLADQEVSGQIISQISKPKVPQRNIEFLKLRTPTKTSSILKSQQRTNQQLIRSSLQKDQQTEQQKIALIDKSDLLLKDVSIVRTDQRIKEKLILRERLVTKQGLQLKQVQEQIQVVPPISPPPPRTPRPPLPKPPKKPVEIIYINPRLPKAKYTKQEPYDAYVLRDSLDSKKKRWEKVNERPLTKGSARSLMARQVDQSISAQGKITKRKPIVQKIKNSKTGKVIRKIQKQVGAYDTKDKYYETNQQKFREFKSKKGTRTPLRTGKYIEKQKYRLDTPGEKRGISLFKRR